MSFSIIKSFIFISIYYSVCKMQFTIFLGWQVKVTDM